MNFLLISAWPPYRTLNMQMQYLMASSLDREPALPSSDQEGRYSAPEAELIRLPLRFDRDLYARISSAAAERNVSIAMEIRNRLEFALNFEQARVANWAALENQIHAVLQSSSLTPAQREGLDESLARCKTDSMNPQSTPFDAIPIG